MLPTPQLLNQVANFIQEQGKSAYYCLFLLGKETGLRVGEAVNFNLSLKKKSNLYLIQGKRHKKRAVFVDPQIIKTLKENHWKPQQTNRFSFAHFLQKTKKELNISKEIELTPHTLHRCFATYQANSGMSLPILQKVLGHSSIRTTALYWKTSQDPKEKVIKDKWLAGKVPKEPTKPIENKPKELPKLPKKANREKILLNIQQKINVFIYKPTRNLALEKEKELWKVAFGEQREQNKLLQEKAKQLEQEKQAQEQIIIILKSDKERLEKQLIQVQKDKENLLKLLSADLQAQSDNSLKQDSEKLSNQELHQQLIAQIQVLTKN
jgi:hypothetical protein